MQKNPEQNQKNSQENQKNPAAQNPADQNFSRRKLLASIGAAAVFAALAAAAIWPVFARSEGAMLALNSAPISLHYDARNAQLQGISGPFMLFFYSKDCGVCERQIPILNALAAELGAEFRIIGVLGGVRDISQAQQNAKGVRFATVFEPGAVRYLSDVVGGIYGVPAMFLYDGAGKLRKKFISLTPASELKKQINLLRS